MKKEKKKQERKRSKKRSEKMKGIEQIVFVFIGIALKKVVGFIDCDVSVTSFKQLFRLNEFFNDCAILFLVVVFVVVVVIMMMMMMICLECYEEGERVGQVCRRQRDFLQRDRQR